MKNQKGFTLLEVIIAITLLAFISIYTSQSIQKGLQDKVKIQKAMEKDTTLRDALNVISNDIHLAFNYRDINIELFNLAQKERKKRATTQKGKKDPNNPGADSGANPGSSPPPPETPVDPANPESDEQKKYAPKKEIVVTQFIGEKEKLNFTALGNARAIADSPYSDQCEVGYELKDCKQRIDKTKTSKCLWRRVSPLIDDKIEEGGKESVLLENVTKLKFRYLGPGNEEEWQDKWITDTRGDEKTKDKFPYAVEVSIEILNQNPDAQKDKALSMTIVSPLAFPNNIEKEEKKDNEKPATTTPAQ